MTYPIFENETSPITVNYDVCGHGEVVQLGDRPKHSCDLVKMPSPSPIWTWTPKIVDRSPADEIHVESFRIT